MAPTPEQMKLIKDYEPILFFQGAGADGQGAERFFPSDAKRYLEQCALWKASTPFTSKSDWGSAPVIAARQIGALPGEGTVFLGKGLPNGPFDFLETPPDKECFLEMTGWDPANRLANLDRLAQRYMGEEALTSSQFWYHAEVFDAVRLRELFGAAKNSGLSNGLDFLTLLEGSSSNPPVLTEPVLICYYLFYPGHDEGLSGCEGISEAQQFASFAGEWTCIAVLFDRPSPAAAYTPKFVGTTNRNVGVIQVAGREDRVTMRIRPWGDMKPLADTHPQFEVSKGSHAYYVPGEAPVPLDPRNGADPSAKDCGLPSSVVDELAHPYGALDNPFLIFLLKLLAGAQTGILGGPLGALGAAAGFIWGAAEAHDKGGLQLVGTPAPTDTVDTVAIPGMVVHPDGVVPPGVDPNDPNKARVWQSKDNYQIGERRYDSTVDRGAQILWPGDPNFKGYTGRWGPRVEADGETRRAGMGFPNFWLLFFDHLVRDNPPARFQFLDSGSSWTVPNDWNSAKNLIECVGAGGGGRTGSGLTGAGGGGGGAYSAIANLALTPGTTVAYTVGVGGTPGNAGGDTYFGDLSFAAAKVGAKGGGGASAAAGGIGGLAAAGAGTTKFSGGGGGTGGNRGGGGGGGAAGPNGDGAQGGNGSTGFAGAGGGGGGNGGGSSGSGQGVPPTTGGVGGNNKGGAGAGKGGAAGAAGAPGADGGGGGGGGGGNPKGGSGGPGGAGSEFDSSHGSGGGGGGGGSGQITSKPGDGGPGASYGGGGGGSGIGLAPGGGTMGGKGAPGLIIIRYSP